MATAVGHMLSFRVVGGRLDYTVIAGVLRLRLGLRLRLRLRLGTSDRGQTLNAFPVRGCITAFPTTIGIATFTRVIGRWIVRWGVGLATRGVARGVAAGIAGQTATTGVLIPGSGGS